MSLLQEGGLPVGLHLDWFILFKTLLAKGEGVLDAICAGTCGSWLPASRQGDPAQTEEHTAVSPWPRSLVSEGRGSARYERCAAHPISTLTGTTPCQKVVLTVRFCPSGSFPGT